MSRSSVSTLASLRKLYLNMSCDSILPFVILLLLMRVFMLSSILAFLFPISIRERSTKHAPTSSHRRIIALASLLLAGIACVRVGRSVYDPYTNLTQIPAGFTTAPLYRRRPRSYVLYCETRAPALSGMPTALTSLRELFHADKGSYC